MSETDEKERPRVTTADIKRGLLAELRSWLPALVTVASVAGTIYGASFRLTAAEEAIAKHEKRIEQLESSVQSKANWGQFNEIRETVEEIKRDVAVIKTTLELERRRQR